MDEELRYRVRGFAKKYRMVDRGLWKLLRDVEELGGGEMTAVDVAGWLDGLGVTLLPWQRKKLGLE